MDVMQTILKVVVAGIGGTTAMTMALAVFQRTEWANADMIRALGSLVTRRYENALGPGLVIHYSGGVLFAFPYVIIMRAMGWEPDAAMPWLGLILGLFHGVAMCYIMLALVAENHPVERFRSPRMEVAAAHLVAHLVYGLAVGLLVAFLNIDFGIRF